jgi:hypothetical protein
LLPLLNVVGLVTIWVTVTGMPSALVEVLVWVIWDGAVVTCEPSLFVVVM